LVKNQTKKNGEATPLTSAKSDWERKRKKGGITDRLSKGSGKINREEKLWVDSDGGPVTRNKRGKRKVLSQVRGF